MLLAAAEGEIVPESAEVQKAALQVRQKYLIDTKNIWSTSLGAVLPGVRPHPAARQRQDRGHPHPQVQAGQGGGPEQRGGHQQGVGVCERKQRHHDAAPGTIILLLSAKQTYT